ncbi:MAG: NUDIX hydrolase [Culicoidibacterales bacterium]
MNHLIEKPHSSTQRFQGRVVGVYEDQVILPNGTMAQRDVVRHPGGVCVLALTAEQEVIFVRQYRYVLDQLTLEIPAGKLDPTDSEPEAAARRELAEETPYTAQALELLHAFYPTPGFCDEKLYLYLAHGVELNSELTPDDDEFVDVVTYPLPEALAMLAAGEITDGKTIMALQAYALRLAGVQK